jgi:hypothetical protein
MVLDRLVAHGLRLPLLALSVQPWYKPPGAATVGGVFRAEFTIQQRFLRVYPRDQDGPHGGNQRQGRALQLSRRNGSYRYVLSIEANSFGRRGTCFFFFLVESLGRTYSLDKQNNGIEREGDQENAIRILGQLALDPKSTFSSEHLAKAALALISQK